MTYCVGIRVEEGLVIIADTRTNAGIDNISIYKKLHVVDDEPGRLVMLASAGSLSVTQSALSLLAEGLPSGEEGAPTRRLTDCTTMFRAAQLTGEAVSCARKAISATLEGTKINAGVSLLLGGRIGDEPLKLYLIYGEGNFIECQPDSPYLQIGELKYGKPILDRALDWTTSLAEAVKVALLSFDATMRSNLSVGLPFDMIVVPSDAARPVVRRRIEVDDAYFADLSRRWSQSVNEARLAIPAPEFMAD